MQDRFCMSNEYVPIHAIGAHLSLLRLIDNEDLEDEE